MEIESDDLNVHLYQLHSIFKMRPTISYKKNYYISYSLIYEIPKTLNIGCFNKNFNITYLHHLLIISFYQ